MNVGKESKGNLVDLRIKIDNGRFLAVIIPFQ